jgi:cytoskeleton-associated protein 5
MLPEIINDLQVPKIIFDLHQFLKAFPSRSWKQRPNDMPLRTIKTILHSLAKLKGVMVSDTKFTSLPRYQDLTQHFLQA